MLMPQASCCGVVAVGVYSLIATMPQLVLLLCNIPSPHNAQTTLPRCGSSQQFYIICYKKRTSGSFHNCRSPSRNKFCKTTLYNCLVDYARPAEQHAKTTNVRSRREVTAGCCVTRHRRCVADLATSQPYLYEVLGDKADTMDAQHLRHTIHKTSHPSRHRSVIVFTEIKKNERESHDCRSPSRNKFCKNY